MSNLPLKRLTGSDLARAMLARGERSIPCLISSKSDADALSSDELPKLITSWDSKKRFSNGLFSFNYAVPIDINYKPLIED